jgi:hypothetical protein
MRSTAKYYAGMLHAAATSGIAVVTVQYFSFILVIKN